MEETEWEPVVDSYPSDIDLYAWYVKSIIGTESFQEAAEKVMVFREMLPEDERIYRTGSSVIILKKKEI